MEGFTMFKLRKQLLIGVTALSFAAMGLTAYAQADGAGGRQAPTPEQQAKFAEKMAKRQAKLHDDLKITAAQEAAWQTFVGKIKPVRPADAPQRPSKEELAKQTAPERMDHQMEFLKRAEARLAEHSAAVKEFYAVLTPVQQKVFDEHFKKMEQHRFGHRGFHHDGPDDRP
jgi:Spy/CpxP family protein refolding chaperone